MPPTEQQLMKQLAITTREVKRLTLAQASVRIKELATDLNNEHLLTTIIAESLEAALDDINDQLEKLRAT